MGTIPVSPKKGPLVGKHRIFQTSFGCKTDHPQTFTESLQPFSRHAPQSQQRLSFSHLNTEAFVCFFFGGGESRVGRGQGFLP